VADHVERGAWRRRRRRGGEGLIARCDLAAWLRSLKGEWTMLLDLDLLNAYGPVILRVAGVPPGHVPIVIKAIEDVETLAGITGADKQARVLGIVQREVGAVEKNPQSVVDDVEHALPELIQLINRLKRNGANPHGVPASTVR
jgi:hypothetical protein